MIEGEVAQLLAVADAFRKHAAAKYEVNEGHQGTDIVHRDTLNSCASALELALTKLAPKLVEKIRGGK